tara:strand:+ start:1387 stop:1938 length:552 start_codon:yes stop_codon:yes gene_type:complete
MMGPNISEVAVFAILAIIAISAALGMLLSNNSVYSALFLVVNFGVVATFYVILGAPFIAMAQVTVYAGAIMVLFLFVIMLLGAERIQKSRHDLPWQRPMSIVLVALLLIVTFYVVVNQNGSEPLLSQNLTSYGSPSAVGQMLFQEYILPFEVTSILLLAAMIGVVVLTGVTKRRRRTRRSRRL